MSFGYGISDLITTSTLAWRIYKSCKDSSDSFKSISGEVASLHILLKEVEENLSGQTLNGSQETQLRTLGNGCNNVLNDLDMLVEKYNSLGTSSQRTWDRMRWGWEDIQSTRQRLISNVTMLTAFNAIIINSSQARVEEKLNQLIAELRAGKREGSVVTTDSINSLSTEDKETWRQLRRELEDIGIAVAVIKQHQHFIVSWLENAVRTGAIEDLADDREAIVHVTLDNGDEGEPLTPDLDLERPFDARTSTRSGSDALTTTSGTLQAHQTVDSATNRRSEVNIPRHILFWHRMNRVLAIAPKGFFDAVREGDLKRVEELLSDPGLNINCRDNEKSTALHLAAWRGNSILAKIILDKGAKIEAKDSGGQTALHCAAIRGHLGLVKLLLANGADIEASTDVGTTALSEAAYRDHSEVVALLLKMGGDVENCGYSKRTALHYAAWTGRATVIEILLKKGAAIEARTKVGFTALLIAASHGHLKAVEMLLNQGANANAKTNNGETALLIASLRGSTNLVKLLLSGRKVNVDVKTHDGRTALYIAASNNHRGIVELLVRKGAFVDAKSVQRAIRRADVDILKLLLKGGKETLVDAKSVGRAIRRGDVDIWKLLLNGGTGVNTSNDNRRTPLDK